MNKAKTFSQHYHPKTEIFEDNEQFRQRFLKTIDNFFLYDGPTLLSNTIRECRSYYGKDIEYTGISNPSFEKTFLEGKINELLDLITVIYIAAQSSNHKLYDLISKLNDILRDESMCYEINDKGEIRYYPDREFNEEIKYTLLSINETQNHEILKLFNDTLNELYRYKNHETPLANLFSTIESKVLSYISGDKCNRLNKESVKEFFTQAHDNDAPNKSTHYNDKSKKDIEDIFISWISICNKYRHGKKDQVNKKIPEELFNFLFATGVSILRFTLQITSNIKS